MYEIMAAHRGTVDEGRTTQSGEGHLHPKETGAGYIMGGGDTVLIQTVKCPSYRSTWPRGVQELQAPRFLDTWHMKVVRSSPLRTGRLYPQEYPVTHF